MTIVIAGLTPTSSYHNREITPSPKTEYRVVVVKSSSSSTSKQKPNFFAKLPPEITKYIFSFDHSIPLPLCNWTLHNQFKQLAESRLLQKFAPQPLGMEAKEVNLMTSAHLKERVNVAVFVQLKIMRTLFTPHELNAETGIAGPGLFPLSSTPLLPLYHLIAYSSQWEKLLSISVKRQKEKYQQEYLIERTFGYYQVM